MKLYHYSNEKDLAVIDPVKFGYNSHTPCDGSEPRAYYYPDKEYREKFFLGARYRYTVKTGSDAIYNLAYDFLGLYGTCSIDELIRRLKRKHYVGLYFLHPSGHKIICLFYSQKIIEKEVL